MKSEKKLLEITQETTVHDIVRAMGLEFDDRGPHDRACVGEIQIGAIHKQQSRRDHSKRERIGLSIRIEYGDGPAYRIERRVLYSRNKTSNVKELDLTKLRAKCDEVSFQRHGLKVQYDTAMLRLKDTSNRLAENKRKAESLAAEFGQLRHTLIQITQDSEGRDQYRVLLEGLTETQARAALRSAQYELGSDSEPPAWY